MDIYSAINLFNQLGENETLEIKKDGRVRKYHFDSNGKKHFTNLGEISNFDNSHQPVKSKLWASAYNPGLKTFNKFGDTLPKRPNKDVEIEILLGIFEMVKDTAVKSKWNDTYLRLEYDVLEAAGIKVYYFKGTPRYVESNGKKHIISQILPELKTERIKTEFGFCSKCGKKMSIISLSEYFDKTNFKEYDFCFICEDVEIRNNRNLVKK